MTFDYPYAGLILPDAQDLSPVPYLNSAAEVLARLDPRPDADCPTRQIGGRMMGQTLGIAVIPEEQSDYGPRVLLEVVTTDGAPPDDNAAARLLSDTVAAALDHSSADILEWYAPDVLIDREDFLRLRGLVSPRHFAQMSAEIEDALFESVLAAQGICGKLYSDTAPAAEKSRDEIVETPGFMAFVNGFGLRRTSQMAAVTSLLAVLTSTGQVDFLISRFIP